VIRFHVNIDHVATLRNARGTPYPDPVFAAQLCEQAGADGITLHLREDRRHIRDEDLDRIKRSVTTLVNLEMAATDEMLSVAERVVPNVITLVPERREERTTEGGLDVVGARPAIERIAKMCQKKNIKLSLFIEADSAQIAASRALGASQVELHTGEYANSMAEARQAQIERITLGAERAYELGLEVAAGHGLTRQNVIEIAAIEPIIELNIGHAVIADAVFVGLERAVRDFRDAISRGEAMRSRV
jgi:pyridoxine 5-phosphate synthase